ncbi:MAG: pyridoxamine 5'-phosphate oxidase [Myxococcales bacterium]|nr:pyridoxamine 5'-phosphate oxidase [Myxococcales bacterium]
MSDLPSEPVARFLELYESACECETFDASRCALATADAEGRPSVRFVLLKTASDEGFEFFTNYESQKAHELDENPYAALAFHWSSLGVQVRVSGRAERLDGARSDAYFASRPRGSQLGAWASHQSEPLPDRETLEQAVHDIEARFARDAIPRPPFWGGYRIVPDRIELWHNRDDRLHDRFDYRLERGPSGPQWTRRRLAP